MESRADQQACNQHSAPPAIKGPAPAVTDGETRTSQQFDDDDNDGNSSFETMRMSNDLAERPGQRSIHDTDDGNKENEGHGVGPRKCRFLDPQPGAHAVPFNEGESQDTPQVIGSSNSQEPMTSQISNDQGYQESASRTAGVRRHAPEQSPTSTSKRLKTSQRPLTNTRTSTSPTEEDGAQENFGTGQPQLTHAKVFKSATQYARHGRQLRTEPEKQVRKGWTDRELNRLVTLIEESGCSWSRLKTIDDETEEKILSRRNQVALKDKARNMKMIYLK